MARPRRGALLLGRARRRLGFLGDAGMRDREQEITGWFKEPGPRISASGIGRKGCGDRGRFVARGRCASGGHGEGDDPDPWVRPGSDTAARTGRSGETGRAGTSCWLQSRVAAGRRAGWASGERSGPAGERT